MSKRTLWLIALLYFSGHHLNGQTSYLDTTYEWTEWLQPVDEITYRYKLSSALTLIDGNNYHEVLRSYTAHGNEWERTEKFIRSDPPRIYWHNGSEEKALYDFSLKPGDEFTYPYGSSERLTVVKVDSITLRNGEKRKLLKLLCNIPYDTSYWVEGLFSLRGLFLEYICEPFPHHNSLVRCIHKDDTLLYRLPYFDSCFYSSTIRQSFMDSRYVWTEYNVEGWGTDRSSTRYRFDETPTRINGIDYNERLASDEPSGDSWERTTTYYRSDGNGKVYISFNDIETLMYDYSLEVNDTFQGFFIVDQIDSITLLNGEKRKRMTMKCVYDDDPPTGFGYSYWIEGLGGDRGVYDIYSAECAFDADGHYTMCIFRNDTLLYDNPDFDSCWYLPVATFHPHKSNVIIYPNPFSDYIDISDTEGVFNSISISGLDGRILYKGAEIPINTTPIPPGIYFAQIKLKNGNSFVQKLIKQ